MLAMQEVFGLRMMTAGERAEELLDVSGHRGEERLSLAVSTRFSSKMESRLGYDWDAWTVVLHSSTIIKVVIEASGFGVGDRMLDSRG